MIFRTLHVVFNVFFPTADKCVALYLQWILFSKERGLYILGTVLARRLQRKYGVFISYSTSFDSSLVLQHPVGIVIGEGVEIGRNVTIFQGVTLGRSDTHVGAYPKIGDNTVIYAGAVVLGDIRIGENCIIGANAVVTKSVPNNSIAVGVPARNISRHGDV